QQVSGRPWAVAGGHHSRPCHGGYHPSASVPDGPGQPGGFLRVGRVERRARHADGRQHVVLPRSRRADAGARVHLAGGGDGLDAGPRHAGRLAGEPTGINEGTFRGGMMRRFGFVAAVAMLGIALVAGLAVRSGDAAPSQGAAVTGRVRFTGAKPTNPRIDMSEDAAGKAKYTTPRTAETANGHT